MGDAALVLARRSLTGLAVGDAFGETMFGDHVESTQRAAKRVISTRRPWRWTDDTAMGLSIVEVLAAAMLRAGYAKVFQPDAAVVHWHDYGPLEQFRRVFDEWHALH